MQALQTPVLGALQLANEAVLLYKLNSYSNVRFFVGVSTGLFRKGNRSANIVLEPETRNSH
jgi:hypothetical protein